MGNVKKYDSSNKTLAGSGIVGNYTNANGASIPKFLGCGNARKADTGALVDELSWNYDDKAKKLPITIVGAKTNSSENYYTAIQKDDSWASWWSNNTYKVIAGTIIVIAAVLTLGFGFAAAAAFVAAGVGMASLTGTVLLIASFISVISGMGAGAGLTYLEANREKVLNDNFAKAMANTALTYTDDDLRKATFAYDANLMMQTDYIGDEENTDKSPLFKQYVNIADPSKNDTIPTIITNFSSNDGKLYYGYDKCNRNSIVSNDPNMDKKPTAHTFDEHGECTYCHFTKQPLEAVYQADGQVDYYAIKTQAQLNYLASAFNGDNEEAYKLYKGASFKLMNDIEYAKDQQWIPIGSYNSLTGNSNNQESQSSTNWHHFSGKFDGQGFTIKGLKTNVYTNYAGLFGYVDGSENTTSIKNVILSNCAFFGNVAGSIAGYINADNSSSNGTASKLEVEKVAADSSVIIANTWVNQDSYVGGLFGIINKSNKESNELKVSYSYSHANILSMTTGQIITNEKLSKSMGTFVGFYNSKSTGNEANPTFEHCYYCGISLVQSPFGTSNNSTIGKQDMDDCYSVGDKTKAIVKDSTSWYVPVNYIQSGHLAYDLMNNSKVTENGASTYFFTQKGNYPVLTNTKQPTLCKVNVEVNEQASSKGLQVADTIININTAKIAVPFTYAGRTFKNAMLRGWEKEERTGTPSYEGAYNDFSELYKTPTRYYTLVLEPKEIPAIANVQNAAEWKGAGVLAGYSQTNIMSDLYLLGSDAWSLQQAPQCIDGTNKIVITGMPLISDVNGSISSARKYFRARSNAPSTQSETENITIQNMRLVGEVLAQDVLSKGNRSLTLNNLILQPISARKVTLDWNTETQAENVQGYNFKNVICKQADSTSVAFYKNGTDVMTTTFSDENKNNDYEHILNYMLSQDGMLDVFGLRLSGKNEKVAGKMGFATEESKRIYRVTLYNQATGLADGEVLMNYDGDITFDVKGSRVGAMHEGVPAGTFAVLPLTEAELGASFKYLGKNVITKDGKATCIRLEEDKIDGFKYPACLGDDVTLRANRGEFVRQVRRDGSLESIMLPFGFMSLEFDEKEFSENDEIELSFADFGEEEGDNCLSADGSTLKLISAGAYQMKQEALQGDSLGETEVALPNVPYLVRLKCTERTDETTAITFSLDDSRFGGGVLFFEDPDLMSALFDPMFGVFQNCTVGEIGSAKGKKVYLLESFLDETTGKMQGKFVRAKDTDHLNAFHCYVATSSSLAGDEIKVSIDEGTSTGINAIKGSSANDKKKIYDMLGRRVNKMTPRNIYIQNGKKIVNF